tara:strand:- start:809 stop:1426 length:618 start_codon:yes stop_codon:yes gene_type:complete
VGMTDQFIIPQYSRLVGDYINKNLKSGDKIAWLGQQQRDKYSDMFSGIENNIKVKNLTHHFYDIENDNTDESFRWDVHSDWSSDIKGYDLVLGLRLAYLVQSSSGLAKNVRKAVEHNKKVMLDFNTGNISTNDSGPYQRWKEGSTNLIPHFPEAFPFELNYVVSDEDHLFSSSLLKEHKVSLQDPKIISDPIKGRIYILTEFIKL